MRFNAKGAALATRPLLDISSNDIAGTFKAKSPKLQGRIEVKPSPALRALKRALAQATEPAIKASLARGTAALEVARGRQ
jgi:hypothetical protein